MRLVGVVGLVLVVAGCGSTEPGTPVAGDEPVVSRVEVTFRHVEEATPGGQATPPDVLTDADGVAYRLGPEIGDFSTFDAVRADNSNGMWSVTIDLTDADTAAFSDWTTNHVGEQLAIVVDGTLITAPTIQSPITEGSVQISGNFTQSDANDMVKAITGR